MLAAVNLAATALHDGVGALTAGFGGTTFVHFISVCFLYFRPRKYPFYIRLNMPRSPPGDPSPVELGEKLLDAANDQSIPRVLEQLDAGADVNYSGSVGETALMLVAHHLNLNMVMLLLEKGADKTIKSSSDGDFDGMNALEIARNYARFDPENPDVPTIIRLLTDDPPPPPGVTPPGGEPEGGAKKKNKKKTGGRRFTRKQCKKFTCAKMGFTQKASCRPYKNCYLQKKKQKKTTKNRK
jgi:hypothetical protein